MGSRNRLSVGNIKNANLKVGIELENKIKNNTKIIQEINRVNNIVLDLKKKALVKARGLDVSYLKDYEKGLVDKEKSIYRELLTLDKAHLMKKIELSKKHNVDELRMKLDALEKVRKILIKEEEDALKRRDKIQKAWDARRRKRNREANAKKKADAIRSEKEEKAAWEKEFNAYLKKAERIQKAWDERRRRRNRENNANKIKQAQDANAQMVKDEKKAIDETTAYRKAKYAAMSKEIVENEKQASKQRIKIGQLETDKLKGRVESKSSNINTGRTSSKMVGTPTMGQNFMGGFNNLATKAGVMAGYAAVAAAVALVTSAIKGAFEAAYEFEKMLADISARGGFTAKEMKGVSEAVFDVAASTKYSISEIGTLTVSLAKLGFGAQDTVNMLDDVANAAAAAGEGLEETGQAIGKTMNIFGIASKNASMVGDMMTKAFTSSALDLKGFSNAMSYAGAAAEASGTSMFQVTAAMEILADRGITASKIGTGLRNIFMELGEEGKDLDDIIQELANGNMTYAESVELVGKRAANQLYILANEYESFEEKQSELYKSTGEAAKRAAEQMDTMSAKFDVLKNNLQISGAQFAEDTGLASIGKYLVAEANFFLDAVGTLKRAATVLHDKNKVMFDRVLETGKVATLEEKKMLMKMGMQFKFMSDELTEASLEGMRYIEGNKRAGKVEADDALQSETDMKKFVKEQTKNLNKEWEFGGEEAGAKYLEGVRKELLDSSNSLDVKYLDVMVNGEKIGERTMEEAWAFQTEQINKQVEAIDELLVKRQNYINQDGDFKAADSDWKKRKVDQVELLKKQMGVKYGGKVSKEKDDVEYNVTGLTDAQVKDADKNKKKILDLYTELCEHGVEAYCPPEKKPKDRKKKTFEVVEAFDKGEIGVEYQKNKQMYEDMYKQAGIDGDPERQLAIKKLLIKNEEDYLNDLKKAREEYIEYIEELRVKNEKNMAKHKEGSNEWQKYKNHDTALKNVQITQSNAMSKDEEGSEARKGTIRRKKTETHSAGKYYKEDAEAARKYAKELAAIELEIEKEINPWKKEKKYNEMLKLTKKYYADEKKAMKKSIKDLQDTKAMMLEQDSEADTTSQDNAIEKLQDGISKVDDKDSNLDSLKIKWDEATLEEKKAMIAQIGSQAVDVAQDIYNAYAAYREIELQRLRDQVAAELEIIQGRYDKEQEMAKAALEAGVITQKQYEEARRKSEIKKVKDENAQNKKLFEAEKAAKLKNAKAEMYFAMAKSAISIWASAGANPILAAILTAVSASAIAVQSGLQIKAINQEKFVPQKFEDGGMVYGKPHSKGGVPFYVKGDNTPREMEGGEFIVNKRATRTNRALLERINGGGRANGRRYANGGEVTANGAPFDNELLQEVLEQLAKPTKAYIVSSDLEKDERSRRETENRINY